MKLRLSTKKILYSFYLLLCLGAVFLYANYSLNYKIFRHYTIKNQELITPIFLNIFETGLDDERTAIIKQINPIGIMLYKDNFKSYGQVKRLVKDLKDIFPKRKLYIAIDQEGGEVDRIKKITKKQTLKSANYYGKIAKKDLNKAKKLLYHDSKETAKIMNDLGININFAPMIDIIYKENDSKNAKSWSATNNRSFSSNPKIIIELAKSFIEGMHAHNVMVTIKHIPGLGRSYKDTHDDAEVMIDAKLEELEKTDFAVFRSLKDISDFAMVGHAIYTDIDNKPATLSKKTINVIRNQIGFKGMLFSDALNMKSVSKIKNIGIKTLNSGVDIIIPNYIDYFIATETVNNIDKETLIKFNKKLYRLGLL